MPNSKPPRPRKKQTKPTGTRKPSKPDKPSEEPKPEPVNPVFVQRKLRFNLRFRVHHLNPYLRHPNIKIGLFMYMWIFFRIEVFQKTCFPNKLWQQFHLVEIRFIGWPELGTWKRYIQKRDKIYIMGLEKYGMHIVSGFSSRIRHWEYKKYIHRIQGRLVTRFHRSDIVYKYSGVTH